LQQTFKSFCTFCGQTLFFQTQIDGKGFSFVEILSTCPTNWGLRPVDATNWLEEHMMPEFPLGEFKTPA